MVSQTYGDILTGGPSPPLPSDWLGFYISDHDILPTLIMKGPGACNIIYE